MEIVRRDLYDYESGNFTVRSERDLSEEELEMLAEFLRVWPERQARSSNYSRSCPRIEITDSSNRKAIRLLAQKWFPEEWFEPMVRALEAEVPALCFFEIGTDFVPPYRDDDAFIRVPEKRGRFEYGTEVGVASFEIAKYPVSIAQFERFTAMTDYRTVAERKDSEDTFRDNQFISDIPINKRESLPALCVSYLDAVAYCEWAGFRLPTEAEWLVAAVIRDEICEDKDLYDRRSELRNHPLALVVDYDELTATVAENGRVVVRAGRYLIRSREDFTSPLHRRLVSKTFCYEHIAFRVCRKAEG